MTQGTTRTVFLKRHTPSHNVRIENHPPNQHLQTNNAILETLLLPWMLFHHPPEQSPNRTDFGASGSFRKVHQTTLRQALAAGRPLTTSLQSQHPAPTQPSHRFSCRKQGLSRLRFHAKSVDSRSSAWLPRMRLCVSYLYAPGAINETSFSKLGFFPVPRWRMPSQTPPDYDGLPTLFRLWVMSGQPTPSAAQFKFTLVRSGAHRVAKTWLELRSRTLFDLQR